MSDVFYLFLCFFAALGIVDAAAYLFDRLCAARLPHAFRILVEDCPDEDGARYAVRFLEGVVGRTSLEKALCGVVIGKNVALSDSEKRDLEREFGNITYAACADTKE